MQEILHSILPLYIFSQVAALHSIILGQFAVLTCLGAEYSCPLQYSHLKTVLLISHLFKRLIYASDIASSNIARRVTKSVLNFCASFLLILLGQYHKNGIAIVISGYCVIHSEAVFRDSE